MRRPAAFQRTPTTTQSAVLYGLTLATASREPAMYAASVRFAITPSSPAASNVSSQLWAASGSCVDGESRKPFAWRSR